jgi:hypothetical protein
VRESIQRQACLPSVQGHYWEKPAWAVEFEFQERVLNFILGNGNRFGIGPSLDVSLFNGPNDDTRVYIMHPRRSPNSDPQSPLYRAKLPRLKDQLIGPAPTGLLPNAPTALWLYKRLNYATPQDRATRDNT